MRRALIPLCLVIGSFMVNGQRSYEFGTAERLFTEGKELFELKNYPGSLDKLQAYKQHSHNADLIQEADYMIACIAFEQGREDAPEVLKDYLEKYPDTRHADEVSFLIGSSYFGQGDYYKAVYWLREADMDLLSESQQELCCYRLAYSLLQTGETDQARAYFRQLQQVSSYASPYRTPSDYYIAYIDYVKGDYTEALSRFSTLKNNPEYEEQSLYFLAQIYFLQNRYDQVIREGEQLLSSYPQSKNNTEVYRILGNSWYHQGDQDKAIHYLSKYVESTSQPLRGDLYLLGVSYFNKGQYRKAIESLGQTTRENDELSQSAYVYLGQSYLKENDKNNARMAFETAATMMYDRRLQEIATYNYALVIHETSFTGFGESVKVFENFLNNFPNSEYADKVNDYLVEVYLTTKNYESALTSIEKINNPSTKILEAKQDILFQLGTQAFANVQMDDAISYFSKAIALGTYNLQARNDASFWRGESYYRKGDYNQAIADYQTYVNNTRQRNTDMYALAYYNLGYSYFKLQRYNDALSRFRQYIDLEKNKNSASYADAFNRIGDCYFNNRQFTLAEENYSRAASVLPSAGDYAVFQKGYVLGLQKDYAGKIRVMDQLIRDFPESQYVDDALYEKGRSYVLLENNRSAAEAFETLIRQFPQSSLARKGGVQLGLVYFNDNQLQKSIDAYKQVINNYPGSEEARVAVQDLKSVYLELNDITSYANYVNSLGGSMRLGASEQDSLTYLAAEKLFMRGDNSAARNSLVSYLQMYPDGAFSPNANYYLGMIAFGEKAHPEALRYFSRVLDQGDTKFLEESLARKAEIEYLQQDYPEALTSFKRLQLVAESAENREAARLGVMRTAQQTGQTQDALLAADAILKEQKVSPNVMTEAQYVRAKALLNQGQPDTALADLQALSKDTRTVYGAEAKYLLAQVYYDRNEDEKAEKELMDYIGNGTPHQYWLARGFILLADLYIRQGDEFQARQYLTSLQNNYSGNDDIAGMIENRLAKLSK